jgi:hypothetical protein
VSPARSILRDLLLLVLLGLLLWLYPKSVLFMEGICGLGTLALFVVERGVARKW